MSLSREHWCFGINTGVSQHSCASPRDFRIRIFEGENYACNFRFDQRCCAGSSPSRVCAGFKADVNGRASSSDTRGIECFDFGMLAASPLSKSFTNDSTIIDDDTADGWIRVSTRNRTSCQLDGTRHESGFGTDPAFTGSRRCKTYRDLCDWHGLGGHA